MECPMIGMETIAMPRPRRVTPKASPLIMIAIGLMSIFDLWSIALGMMILMTPMRIKPVAANGIGVDIPGRDDVNGSPFDGHKDSPMEFSFILFVAATIDEKYLTVGREMKSDFKCLTFLTKEIFRPILSLQSLETLLFNSISYN